MRMKKERISRILNVAIKVLAVLLLGAFMSQLYTKYACDVKQILPDSEYITIIILRWLSIVTVGMGVVTPFFGGKSTKIIFPFFAIAIGVLNLVFFENNMIAWGMGREAEFSVANGYAYVTGRVVCFIIEQVILLTMGVYYFIKNIISKEYKGIQPLWIILTLVGFLLTFDYPYILQDLNTVLGFTTSKVVAIDFSTPQIIYLSLNIVLVIALSLILKKQSFETKRMALVTMALSANFNFFYTGLFDSNSFHFSVLPFHLCNLAVILLFFAFAFHFEGLFYFTLFVNVLGTIFAMLMPDSGSTDYWYTYNALRFWYNHIYDFVLPICGITLGVFARPKMKSMLKAIGIFTCYFLLSAVLNAWFNNYGVVNYFFINDNFFFEKLNIGSSLKDNFVWEFKIGDLTFRFYPLFHLVVWGVFVALMFVVWYVYDFFFNVSDSHVKIHYKKKLLKDNYIDFKKALKGHSIHDPIYSEDVDMIEIKNFTKVYSGSNTPSVENLNLTIHDGEVYGFLGHNGAGKSTTIKSLVGIQSITSGQMIVDGYDVSKQPVEAKLRIGYVSDNHAVYERLTGREYINYIADLYMVPKAERDERITKYTKMFKLEDAIDREIKSYSHGMKQKIVVISSLIHDPKVWILDEPLTGLDPTSAFQIKECMREHASRGNIVFFSSHVIEVVEKICTRICIIGHGKLQCEYSLKELKEKGISLESLYLKYVSNEERIH